MMKDSPMMKYIFLFITVTLPPVNLLFSVLTTRRHFYEENNMFNISPTERVIGSTRSEFRTNQNHQNLCLKYFQNGDDRFIACKICFQITISFIRFFKSLICSEEELSGGSFFSFSFSFSFSLLALLLLLLFSFSSFRCSCDENKNTSVRKMV
jgi:hypothetical protein